MDDPERKNRKLAVDATKRELIRSAAKKLFADFGLERTSVREIARLAGYTTGAIYFHYANKEELYADILRASLDQLFMEVERSVAPNGEPLERLAAAFRALVRFYDQNPRDLDLSLYLLNGARPRGLTPKLNRELNEKLLTVLDVFRTELSRAGIPDTQLNVEVAVIFDEMIGSLVAAHTGRLRVIGTDLASVVDRHTTNLALRLPKARKRS
ncbi:TetR/AcrR family transcriptional regulator [Bradyrhizobium sp. NP1]|uniref:TetR/AcrR family transcriptional regulator n=1 Tax=Bradyrhizobium sp. NP1 TaxID=3049772 RepID=UPI0025A5739C|nr:TetR/AcrR family transcriptional regulator [Bradyrhizobium sp. NP1]WJR80394.1 TetR/AcrR family transcriptional regulator [Bradyrhizobium sp. NP1]